MTQFKLFKFDWARAAASAGARRANGAAGYAATSTGQHRASDERGQRAAGAGRGVTPSPGGRILEMTWPLTPGEVRVNVGGEPDRDDFGLPPVDIEIPDDARELVRDVQAYHRELRAQRRQMRIGRLHAPLTRDGLVLPLLAGFLAMVLISGVLLTVFTAGQSGAPRTSASPQVTNASISQAPPASRPAPTPGRPAPGARLPAASVVLAGQPVQLRSLVTVVLALAPAGCQCGQALRRLRRQAHAAGVHLYLVGGGGDMPQVRRLALRTGQPAAKVADDKENVLAAAYRPHGLTAVLVRSDGTVGPVVRRIGPASRLTRQLRLLAPAGS